MPYLPLELDAKKVIPKVARAAGVTPGDVTWGLLETWEHVFITKRDVLSDAELDGCLGESPSLRRALIAFGFLEPRDGGFYVKGSKRILGTANQNATAGKARASGAQRDARGRLVSPADHQRASSAAGPPLDSATSRNPALTPNTKHPTPKLQKEEEALPLFGSGSDEEPNPPAKSESSRDETERAISALQAAWNDATTPPLSRWASTASDRRRRAASALQRRPLEQWREVFARIEASSFCRGENDRGWRADADWALRPPGAKPEPAAKLLEGAFDDRRPKSAAAALVSTGPPRAPCAVCDEPSLGPFWGQPLCGSCGGAWQADKSAPTNEPDMTRWVEERRRGDAA